LRRDIGAAQGRHWNADEQHADNVTAVRLFLL
jgi:hypothetical protein